EPDLQVVGGAGTIADALAMADAMSDEPGGGPAVAVIDLRLPDGSGVELCRELRSRRPGLHCVFLTSYDADDALFSAIMGGADGYVLKQMVGFELVNVIRKAGAGQRLLDGEVVASALAGIQRQRERTEPAARLTPPEPQVLDLIVSGQTNREIATRLELPEEAVRGAVSSLLEKLSWRNARPLGRAGEPPARTPGTGR
ncbi:MAG: response regulator, partial [Micromonosporaceae bacterium]